MTETKVHSWQDANQRYLMARLSTVRRALEGHIARSEAGKATNEHESSNALLEEKLAEAKRALAAPSAIDRLCELFTLSPFERDVLLLCAGVELDSAFGSLYAAANGNQRPYPTFSLALAALPEPHWSALLPAAPLRRWRLLELGSGDALTTSHLRIDERVLHYLAGLSCIDARLSGLIEPAQPAGNLPPSYRKLTQDIARLWSQSTAAGSWPFINLCGSEHEPKESILASAGAQFGIQTYVLRGADIPTAAVEREALLRLWERESALTGSVLLLDASECEIGPHALAFIENSRATLVIASREPVRSCRRRIVRFDVNKPAAAEQQMLWQEALGPIAAKLNGRLDTLVSQFSLGRQQIHSASSMALAGIESVGPVSTVPENQISEVLWDACRAQARSHLDDLAERIEAIAGWSDLVLPQAQIQSLHEIAGQVRQRTTVYEGWQFATKGKRGLGISALFAGASGTGKTMAAEVLAGELRLDLYRIDLSQVVSKYIGETEKNLRRVFDGAEESGAVLLFDEADALFGKRSEVKDSHDRYANIEISYLLQRMESYRGLAILTTNMKSALDPAFLRRIRFIIQFPFPDVARRAEIWRRILPEKTPTDNLDWNKLARLNVTGGHIRSIALNAAFFAADDGEPIRMSHLLRAARGEYSKLEKPMTDAEIGGWV